MGATSTLRRRLTISLGVQALLASAMIVDLAGGGAPGWAKAAGSVITLTVAAAGAWIAATYGRDTRRFLVALVLVVVGELVAFNVFLNAACFLGGCGD